MQNQKRDSSIVGQMMFVILILLYLREKVNMMKVKSTILFLAIIALPAIAQAQTYAANNWIATVPDSDFSNGANWSLGYFPKAGTTAPIELALVENGVVGDVLTAPPYSMGQLWLGANGGTATVNMSSGSLTVADWIIVGQGYNGNTLSPGTGGTGTLNLSGTAVLNQTTTGEFHIGEGSNAPGDPITTGIVNVSGSAVVNSTGGDVEIGYQRNGNGTLTVEDNAAFNFKPSPSAKWFFIGRYLGGTGGTAPSGTMTVKDNATFTFQGAGDSRFFVGGDGAGTTGTLNIQNNATVNLQGWCYLGWFGGTGTVNQSGGTVTYNGLGNLVVGGYGGASTGTWNQTGGTFNCTTTPVVLTDGPNNTGNYYLSGGTLNTMGIQMGIPWDSGTSSTGNFYFNGGTLRASASSTNFITQNNTNGGNSGTFNVYVSSGGANIDTNGYNVTVAAPVELVEDPASPGGGLTKLGQGTLTLMYPTNFTGNTLVSGGTLIMSTASWSPTTTVASGATLGGSCQFLDVAVNAPIAGVRGNLAPGISSTNNGLGSMQMTSLTMTAAQLNYQIHTAADSDQIVLSGNLSASSSGANKNLFTFTQVNGADTAPGTYPLITYGTFGTGSINDFAMADDSVGSFDATLQDSGTAINLVLTAANEWQGTTSTYNLAGNWKTGAVPRNLGDKAVFASMGTTGAVDLSISPTLGKILFNNSSRNYVIGTSSGQSITLDTTVLAGPKVIDNAGSHEIQVNMTMNRDAEFSVASSADVLTISGVIGGVGRVLTKSGPGSLVLSGANSYSGATVINDGILQANALALSGTNCSIGAGTDLTINGGTFQYTGANVTIDRNLNVGASVPIDTANNITISGTISAALSAAFTKTGAGLLKYTNGGTNTIASGTGGVYFVSNGSVEFAGGSGSVYNVNSGLCWWATAAGLPAILSSPAARLTSVKTSPSDKIPGPEPRQFPPAN